MLNILFDFGSVVVTWFRRIGLPLNTTYLCIVRGTPMTVQRLVVVLCIGSHRDQGRNCALRATSKSKNGNRLFPPILEGLIAFACVFGLYALDL